MRYQTTQCSALCDNGHGQAKKAYPTAVDALCALDRYMDEGGSVIDWYQCGAGSFHLTSMTRAEQDAAGFETR